MIEGACHCGQVRWEVPEEPDWLTQCTCSYCARSGALWAAYPARSVTLRYEAGAVIRYEHGDRTLAFISCGTCGCTTHYESNDPAPDARMKVNMRMAVNYDFTHLALRVFDGADSWRYLDE